MSDGAVLTPAQRRSPATPANRRNGRNCPITARTPSPSIELTPSPHGAAANQAR